MPLGEGGGGVPDLSREWRPPRLGMAPFSELSLENQEIGRGELRGRRHRPSACARCRHRVPHACRRDTHLRGDQKSASDPCRPNGASKSDVGEVPRIQPGLKKWTRATLSEIRHKPPANFRRPQKLPKCRENSPPRCPFGYLYKISKKPLVQWRSHLYLYCRCLRLKRVTKGSNLLGVSWKKGCSGLASADTLIDVSVP